MLIKRVAGAGGIGKYDQIHFDYDNSTQINTDYDSVPRIAVVPDDSYVYIAFTLKSTLMGNFQKTYVTKLNRTLSTVWETAHGDETGGANALILPYTYFARKDGWIAVDPKDTEQCITSTISSTTAYATTKWSSTGTIVSQVYTGNDAFSYAYTSNGTNGTILSFDSTTVKANDWTTTNPYGRSSLDFSGGAASCVADSSHIYMAGSDSAAARAVLQKSDAITLVRSTDKTFNYAGNTSYGASLAQTTSYIYYLWWEDLSEESGTQTSTYVTKLNKSDLSEIWTVRGADPVSGNPVDKQKIAATSNDGYVYVLSAGSTTYSIVRLDPSNGSVIDQKQIGGTTTTGRSHRQYDITVSDKYLYIMGAVEDGTSQAIGNIMGRFLHQESMSNWGHTWFSFSASTAFYGTDRTITIGDWPSTDSSSTTGAAARTLYTYTPPAFTKTKV